MTNKIVQGALDGKLGISQNMGVKLRTGIHVNSGGNLGKEMKRRKHGQFGKKRQKEKMWVENIFL